MDIAERLPSLTDQQLAIMRANAERLAEEGTNKQQAESARMLTLIEAEIADRKARAPAPVQAVRRSRKA